MNPLARLVRRLRYLFTRRRLNRELDEELRFHIETETTKNVRAGMSPEDARRAALVAFGGVERHKEVTREARGTMLIEDTLRDAALALREMRRRPGFAGVAIATLALGIGSSTVLFGAVDSIVLRRLPVPEPGRLVLLGWSSPTPEMAASVDDRPVVDADTGVRTSRSFSNHAYEAFRREGAGLSSVFAFARIEQLNAFVDGEAEIASGQFVSGDYYTGLGLLPAAGRLITREDDDPGAPPVAVLSYGYWERRFGLDPAAIGRTVELNGVSFTIAGVTPASFSGTLDLGESPDLSVPLAFETALRGEDANSGEPWNWWLFIMGRLAPGAQASAVRAGLQGIFQRTTSDGWTALPADVRSRPAFQGPRELPTLRVMPGSRGLADSRRSVSRRLRILSALAFGILLIAGSNVAGLLLVRTEARRREIAVRGSLGASRPRLIRQLATEGLVLSICAGLVAVLVAFWTRDALFSSLPLGNAASLASAVGWPAFSFAIALSLLTGAIVGVLPAIRATRDAQQRSVVGMGRAGALSERTRLRTSMAVGQVGVSFVLVTLAGLFAVTLRNLEHVDVGFEADHLLLFRMDPRLSGYQGAEIPSVYETIAGRIESVPGVSAVTLSRHPLLAGSYERTGDGLFVQGPGTEIQEGTAYLHRVRWNFFETMGEPLLSGRALAPLDDGTAPHVAVVNETFVRRFFPSSDPIGGRFSFGSPTAPGWEIVGVVRDAKYTGLREDVPSTIYVPYTQAGPTQMNFAVRTAGDPMDLAPAVVSAIRSVDARLPVFELRSQLQVEGERLAGERRMAVISSGSGLLGLFLTSLALYGTLSFLVSCRIPEIGIRMALGAQRSRVVTAVVRETAVVVGVGVLIGLLVMQGASRLVAGQLFGLDAGAAPIQLLSALMLTAVGLAAAYLPARRASRVDPVAALRGGRP